MHEKVLIDLNAYISVTDNEVRGKKEIIKVAISKFIIYLIYILWSWSLKAMYLLNWIYFRVQGSMELQWLLILAEENSGKNLAKKLKKMLIEERIWLFVYKILLEVISHSCLKYNQHFSFLQVFTALWNTINSEPNN